MILEMLSIDDILTLTRKVDSWSGTDNGLNFKGALGDSIDVLIDAAHKGIFHRTISVRNIKVQYKENGSSYDIGCAYHAIKSLPKDTQKEKQAEVDALYQEIWKEHLKLCERADALLEKTRNKQLAKGLKVAKSYLH